MKLEFSVIIPVYNAEKFLVDCLNSVERAIKRLPTDVGVEVICVDDGSTDTSGSILDTYAVGHKWCRVLHQKNAGVCFARNKGLEAAGGEWVSFIDNDDFVEEDYFSSFIAADYHADVNFFAWERFVGTGECRINGFADARYIEDREAIGDLVFSLIFNRTGENLFGYTWNKFIRRSLIEKYHIRFPELKNFIEYEDEIFAFKLCQHAQSVAYLPRRLYHYRLGDNNSSRHRIPRHLERSQVEIEIGDGDDRPKFKSAAYMQAGMALLMRSYTSPSLRAALDAARFMKRHQDYLVPVPNANNRLSWLSRQGMMALTFRLFLHGCAYALKRRLQKAPVGGPAEL